MHFSALKIDLYFELVMSEWFVDTSKTGHMVQQQPQNLFVQLIIRLITFIQFEWTNQTRLCYDAPMQV